MSMSAVYTITTFFSSKDTFFKIPGSYGTNLTTSDF